MFYKYFIVFVVFLLFLRDDSYLIFNFDRSAFETFVGGPIGGDVEGCSTCSTDVDTPGLKFSGNKLFHKNFSLWSHWKLES